MTSFLGWGGRIRGLFADTKGPWGPSGDDEPPSNDGGGSGPWGESGPRKRRTSITPGGNVSSFDELFRRSRARFGGGGGLPGRPNGSIIAWIVSAILVLWLVGTSFHSVAPGQRGVVTRFGRYSYTLSPGVGFTLPSPVDRVQKVDVENIRSVDLGSENSDDLMLTGDQNLLDIAYSVRWNIRTQEL
jgi:membrane protease subunit HflK